MLPVDLRSVVLVGDSGAAVWPPVALLKSVRTRRLSCCAEVKPAMSRRH